MEALILFILGLACGYLFTKADDNKEILRLEKENCDLRKWKFSHSDAERRATTFVRKLKKLEDIIIEDQKKEEFDTVTLSKIKKELLITR